MVRYLNAICIPDSPTIWIPNKWTQSCVSMIYCAISKMHLNFYKYCTVRISYCRIHYIRLQLAKRNSSLHLILYESSLRLIQFFSILSFRIWSLLSRIFFPTSYFCLLKKLILADLSLSAIWKLRYINSSSHRSFLSNLYSTFN